MSSPSTVTRVVAAAAAVLTCFLIATSASANPPTDPCGVVTQFEASHAFGFRDARKHSDSVREPGNSAGVVRIRCRLTVWDRRAPSNGRQERQKLLNGEMATLRIESWVPDQGPQAEKWLANFPSKIKGLTERARSQFIGNPLNGAVVSLPKEGVPHALAFAARAGGLSKARAFWWNRRGTILSINVVQGASSAANPSIRRFVARVVRPFFKG